MFRKVYQQAADGTNALNMNMIPRIPMHIFGVALVIGACLGDGVSIAAELKLIGKPVVTSTFHGRDEIQVLPESRSIILSQKDRRGAAVQWTAGPFIHSTSSRFAVDTRLQLLPPPGKNGAFVVLKGQDETNIASGDGLASVAVGVVKPGAVGVRLQVTFVSKDASSLAAGVYTTRIVGTVTGP